MRWLQPFAAGCSRYHIRTSPALDVCRTNMQRTLAAPCLAPSRQLVHVPASSTQPARYRVLELGARGSTWSEGLRTNQSPSPGFNCLPVRTRTRCSAPFHVLLGSTSPFSVLGSLFHFPFPSILSHPTIFFTLSTLQLTTGILPIIEHEDEFHWYCDTIVPSGNKPNQVVAT